MAQYLAWTEIIRKEIQFIDLGKEDHTRHLAHLQDRITGLWSTDRTDFEGYLRLWAGEQRAIGELLIREGSRGPECMGYSEFLDALEVLHTKPSSVLKALQEDVEAISQVSKHQLERMVELQHALLELLSLLDPEYLRFPEARRTKLERPSAA